MTVTAYLMEVGVVGKPPRRAREAPCVFAVNVVDGGRFGHFGSTRSPSAASSSAEPSRTADTAGGRW